MADPGIIYKGLTPDRFWLWGRIALWGGFSLFLVILFYLTLKASILLYALPVLLIGGAVALFLFQQPLLNLCVVIVGFALVADFEEGIQAAEALYGLYYLAFLAHWFAMRFFFYREPILNDREDRVFFVFLVLMTCSVGLTVVFGGSLRQFFSEWVAMTMLGLYFPIKEACVRYKNGLRLMLLCAVTIALFAVLRNLLNYQAILASASMGWQVARGRVYTNDTLLMVASVATFIFLFLAQTWRMRFWLGGSFLVIFAGLILTQSRGMWVGFLLGVFIMFVFINWKLKLRLVLLGLGLGSIAAIIGSLFISDLLLVVLGGLLERLTSLGSAFTKDISLINRFFETAGVWDTYIEHNPVLGHGMAVKYSVFDITWGHTLRKSFVHNGYVSLWFRFGLWGLGMVLFFWLSVWWKGLQVFRKTQAERLARLSGLAMTASLTALALTTITSNPFFLNDGTFVFAVLTGLAGGAYARVTTQEAAT